MSQVPMSKEDTDLISRVSALEDAVEFTDLRSQVTRGEICQDVRCAFRIGKLVVVSGVAKFEGKTINTDYNFVTGLPPAGVSVSVAGANEYGSAGTATFKIDGSSTAIKGKTSTANNFYYFEIVYYTTA